MLIGRSFAVGDREIKLPGPAARFVRPSIDSSGMPDDNCCCQADWCVSINDDTVGQSKARIGLARLKSVFG